jgi:hypothetical protein
MEDKILLRTQVTLAVYYLAPVTTRQPPPTHGQPEPQLQERVSDCYFIH